MARFSIQYAAKARIYLQIFSTFDSILMVSLRFLF